MWLKVSAMLTEERRQTILEQLRARSMLSVAELSERLAVSPMTIRRDLQALEAQGALLRVRGGAASLHAANEPSLISREEQSAEEKEAIGQAAAGLVADGDVIILDAGTTTQHLARNLRTRRKVVVVTNAINVAAEILRCEGVEVIIVGGKLKKKEMSLVGPFGCHALGQIHADKLFLSVAGVDPEAGLTDYDLLEVDGKQAMIRAAREVILLADHTKFGVVSFARIAPLQTLHKVVTDSGTPLHYLDTLRQSQIEVIVCPVGCAAA